MKTYKKLAIVALALAAIVVVIIYGIKLTNIIVQNWSAIVDWLSYYSIYTAGICICVALITRYLCSKKAKKLFSWDTVTLYKIRDFGLIIIIILIILFFANIFFIFNYFGLLRLWLIILGGAALLGAGIMALREVTDRVWQSNFSPMAISASCILALTYYLDIFIFTWNCPWISGVATALMAILFTLVFINDKKTARNDKKTAREEEIIEAQCAAKIAADEMIKMKNEAEAEEKLRARLSSMSFYDIIISYFNEKRDRNNELISWGDVVFIYIEACTNLKGDAFKIDAKQKLHVAFLLSRKSNDRKSDFFRVAARAFEASDIEALLFTNLTNGDDALPESFNQSSLKEEVINNFLADKFDAKYRKILYNSIKKEFAQDEFYGLINALIYSYEKTWDEERSKKIINRISEIFAFANNAIKDLWNDDNKDRLLIYLKAIKKRCIQKGVQVNLPAIKQ